MRSGYAIVRHEGGQPSRLVEGRRVGARWSSEAGRPLHERGDLPLRLAVTVIAGVRDAVTPTREPTGHFSRRATADFYATCELLPGVGLGIFCSSCAFVLGTVLQRQRCAMASAGLWLSMAAFPGFTGRRNASAPVVRRSTFYVELARSFRTRATMTSMAPALAPTIANTVKRSLGRRSATKLNLREPGWPYDSIGCK